MAIGKGYVTGPARIRIVAGDVRANAARYRKHMLALLTRRSVQQAFIYKG